MKTLKIIVALTLVVAAVSLLIASAYAYTGTVVANSAPTGTAYGSYFGGMMGSSEMMRGYGYCNFTQAGAAPQLPGDPSTTTPPAPSGQYPIGEYGCIGMRSRLP